MGTIENRHLATGRRGMVNAPEEIMSRFFARRYFEPVHSCPLRIHVAEKMVNGAIFTAGIHGLQDYEKRPLVFGVHQILQFPKLLRVLVHLIKRGFLGFVFVLETSVDFVKFNGTLWFDSKFIPVVHGNLSLRWLFLLGPLLMEALIFFNHNGNAGHTLQYSHSNKVRDNDEHDAEQDEKNSV